MSSATESTLSNGVQTAPVQHIWMITGPAGCGKTTVANFLSKELDLPYIEGDDFHSQANKDKMANNQPLTDADRWDWLIQLREEAIRQLNSPKAPSGVFVTCSALRQRYRDVIRVAAYDHPNVQIHFIFLSVPAALVLSRVAQRQGHYMKSGMVESQFDILETPDSEWDVLSVDCSGPPLECQAKALQVVRAELAAYEQV